MRFRPWLHQLHKRQHPNFREHVLLAVWVVSWVRGSHNRPRLWENRGSRLRAVWFRTWGLAWFEYIESLTINITTIVVIVIISIYYYYYHFYYYKYYYHYYYYYYCYYYYYHYYYDYYYYNNIQINIIFIYLYLYLYFFNLILRQVITSRQNFPGSSETCPLAGPQQML